MKVVPLALLPHTVTVRPKTGSSSTGPVYGPAVPVRAFVAEQRKLVRNAAGKQVVSNTQLVCRPNENIPEGSLVTWRGRDTEVISVSRADGGGMNTPDHLEVSCQ